MSGRIDGKRRPLVTVGACIGLSMAGIGLSWAAYGAPPVTTPGEIPANSAVQTIHRIKSKQAALRFTMDAGISIDSLRTKSGSSPFDKDSRDVTVELTTSRPAALAASSVELPKGAHEGDAVTCKWTEGCGIWRETFTFGTGAWAVTQISWTVIPKCMASSIDP